MARVKKRSVRRSAPDTSGVYMIGDEDWTSDQLDSGVDYISLPLPESTRVYRPEKPVEGVQLAPSCLHASTSRDTDLTRENACARAGLDVLLYDQDVITKSVAHAWCAREDADSVHIIAASGSVDQLLEEIWVLPGTDLYTELRKRFREWFRWGSAVAAPDYLSPEATAESGPGIVKGVLQAAPPFPALPYSLSITLCSPCLSQD